MAVQLKHDIRGYHAGNISKRYLREAEAADEFELSSNEVIAYATAAGALYRLPRTSLIHRERMETFMKHLYKIPISGKVIEKKYVRLPYRMMFCISDSSTSPLSCLTHCSLIERIQVIRPFGIVTHFDSSGDLLITGIMSIVQLPISTISVFFAIVGILSTTAA